MNCWNSFVLTSSRDGEVLLMKCRFLQMTNEMNYQEARTLLEQLAQKFPQYSTLAENNLAYLQL